MDAAIRSGAAALKIAAGDYEFGAAPFVVAGAHALRISGAGNLPGGSTLWFSPGFGVEIVESSNITVEGFAVDTLTPAFSQGTLLSLDAASQTAVVQVAPDYPLPLASDSWLFNQTCNDSGGGAVCGEIKVIYWDPSTRRMCAGQPMQNPLRANTTCDAETRVCSVNLVVPVSWTPPAHSLVTMSPRAFATRYAIPSYYKGTTLIYNSSEVVLQHYDMHAAADMTHLENLGAGGHIYNDCNIRRRPSAPTPPGYGADRLLASNSDGFHSFSVERGPTLQDSELSFMADDFINLHNRILLLACGLQAVASQARGAVGRSVVLTIVDPGDVLGHASPSCAPFNVSCMRLTSTTYTMSQVVVGDELKLYTTEPPYRQLATALVSGPPVMLTRGSSTISPALPASWAPRMQPETVAAWKVPVIATGAGGVPPYGALVQLDRLASSGAVVQRNYFHDSYNNVGRFAASNLLVAGNIFERAEDGIHVSYDIVPSFLEGSLGMTNISLANNTFSDVHACGPGRSGTGPCAQVCANMTCVLSHVETDLAMIVHATDNHVVATSSG